jgi:VanZ family protein
MKFWIKRWGPAVIMMALIFIASSIPGAKLPQIGFWDTLAKKGGHIIGYALLSAAFLHAVCNGKRPRPIQVVAALCLTILYAVSDELHQGFTLGRTPSVRDVFIDAFGGLIGIALWNVIQIRFARR